MHPYDSHIELMLQALEITHMSELQWNAYVHSAGMAMKRRWNDFDYDEFMCRVDEKKEAYINWKLELAEDHVQGNVDEIMKDEAKAQEKLPKQLPLFNQE